MMTVSSHLLVVTSHGNGKRGWGEDGTIMLSEKGWGQELWQEMTGEAGRRTGREGHEDSARSLNSRASSLPSQPS